MSKISDLFKSLVDWYMSKDDLWLYNPKLHLSAQKIVLEKFDFILMNLCEHENIKVKIFPTLEELNKEKIESNKGLSRENYAVGIYGYKFDEYNKILITENLPYIYLTRDYHVYTMAHELGHHFSIKLYNDNSEKAASNFIYELAKKYLTDLEIYIINIGLKCHSELKRIELPKIKYSEWKEFKRIHNIK